MDYLNRKSKLIGIRAIAVIAAFLLLASCGSASDSTVAAAADDVAPVVATTEAVATAAPAAAEEASSDADDTDTSDDTDANDTDNSDDGDHEHDADGEHADDDTEHEHADDDTEHDDTENSDVDASMVANASYLDSYTLVDEAFGTMVTVTVELATRTIESNVLPNHETGDFPNEGNPNEIAEQDRTWTLTTEPTYTGNAQPVRETGVALNGIKFEPGTGESVSCETGETYRIEGLQEAFDLGMDFNNAHVQPTGEYHYHGVSELLVEAFENDADLVVVGFAADGHTIYYSKSNAYEPGYALVDEARVGTDCAYRTGPVEIDGSTPDGTYVSDWTYVDGQGDLDECNGTVIDDEYAYVITEQYPYISRCLMGEFTEAGGGGGGAAPGGAAPDNAAGGDTAPGGAAPGGQGGQTGQGGAPDLTDAAEALGLSEQELQTLLGGPPPDVGAAATALGMTEEDLMAVLAEHGVAPPAN